ncbi:hypothetical protein OG746_26915 [Streptomyces sp. NBC_01016]|uniref:hypothetical protein n=1 Tax=Streptomyces sp. NBC_01016 TaxID=2903720 RepID=UPI002251F180|nr:hypothetical protein [Streptomyces sp. NBC_01016]MCX4827137.1 hypothetical protein [Streptomyces sp. NBC_01016]MCX4832374.1 hypothetical protein [Streptomyces sp. NBC_01016]
MTARTAARAVRAFVRGPGRHRHGGRPTPIEQRPVLLDDADVDQLLADGDIEANECAPCPCCSRTTFHAMHTDGSRTCWTCGTTTAGEQ